MTTLALVVVLALVMGGLGGAAVSWWQRRKESTATPEPDIPPEHWLAGQVDQAAEAWADAQGRPEAKGLMANKLHMLVRFDQKRRKP